MKSKKGFYSDLQSWGDVLRALSYPRSTDQVLSTLKEFGIPADVFKKECENFYTAYLEFLGYQPTHGPSRSLTRQFNTIAKILHLLKDVNAAEEVAPSNTLFDVLLQEDFKESEPSSVAQISLNSEGAQRITSAVESLSTHQGSFSIVVTEDHILVRYE